MKVWITLDYIDGTKGRINREPAYLDEIDLRGMLFKLNERNVACITFTRADLLNRMDDNRSKPE